DLAPSLPRARQIPLLHLFSHLADAASLRIPQSGWLDETVGERPGRGHHNHAVVKKVLRTHRWQRVPRDSDLKALAPFEDQVSVALFSTDPDDLGLYGKPMARNAQIWNEDYALILDGPRATPLEIARAAATINRGGRFGYRFYYPPMRAGERELFWHLPLVARLGDGAGPQMWDGDPLHGYAQAECPPERAGGEPIALVPRPLARPGYLEAASIFDAQPGHARFSTGHNLDKLLAFRALLDGALPGSFARALTHAPKHESLEAWLADLPGSGSDAAGSARCAALAAQAIGEAGPERPDLTFAATGTRAFEEKVWSTIAGLAEGRFRTQENADGIRSNAGKTGGRAAKAVRLELASRREPERDLDRLADHLHERYRALIAAHQMTGRAEVVDHAFRWETDFPFRWSDGWSRNQSHEAHERNVVLMIPGRDRGEAVIMADHYDTAYMEDVYEEERGGDGLRAAAAGADDNHSATTALLLAAETLLALSREGKLQRDVWLVHLTGEEFPSDCLGARALAQALVERRLRFAAESGAIVDVSSVRVRGVFVLDMIAHNNEHDRDVFQIAPGEGAASARLALEAHLANERWNRQVALWNQAPDRKGRGRAERQEHGATIPAPFAHLALRGEVRPEWDPRSALYNTDGQIFSDVGIPVVLFMENYDINRTGYHDTADTMKNIDLDYAAALTAIAIETVASVASAP
ncbi:MAG TPA: M28 family peptidase, partial [Polyangia bacterium]|nr:M28 family peptidase [Polyangia bacterium]